jgi:hypothetical protein
METTNKIGTALEDFAVANNSFPSVILVGRSLRETLDVEAIKEGNTFLKFGSVGDTVCCTFCDIPLIVVDKAANDLLEVK